MPNIQEFGQKIKVWADRTLADWGIFLIVILASLGSFGLGRFSALEQARPLINVSESPQNALGAPLVLGGMVVASKSGETYYFPWCAGAAKILPANQRLFASADAAKKAGLHPAKACKGLE